MKHNFYNLVTKASYNHKFDRIFDYSIISLILLCAVSIVLESVDSLQY